MTIPTPAIPASVVPEPVPAARSRKAKRDVNRPLEPIEVTLTGFASGGKAVGHAPDGRVVFVEYAIPGERVIAEVTDDRPSYIEATAVLVLEASEDRVEPACQYFGKCGGCQLQHIAYRRQLELKADVVRDQLHRIGKFSSEEVAELVRPMLGMDEPWGYRNHNRFTVRRDGQIGFMQRGTHRFMRVEECLIAHPRVNEVLQAAQDHTMQARQLSVRVGVHTDEEMVQPRLQWRPGPKPKLASGQTHYSERLNGVDYRVSGPAFFQVNTLQAERLVALVVQLVAQGPTEMIALTCAGLVTLVGIGVWTSGVGVKASVHMGVWCGVVAVLAVALSAWWWTGLVLAPAIAWSRMRLKHHTREEIAVGAGTGLVIAPLTYLVIVNFPY